MARVVCEGPCVSVSEMESLGGSKKYGVLRRMQCGVLVISTGLYVLHRYALQSKETEAKRAQRVWRRVKPCYCAPSSLSGMLDGTLA